MVVEFVIASVFATPFAALWYFEQLSLSSAMIAACCVIGTLYWIPKWLIINPMTYLFPSIIFRNQHLAKTGVKKIALTFDDVPHSTGAHNEILTILNEYNTKGTFFAILHNDYPVSLVDAVQKGHQIANHGATNSVHAIRSPSGLINEIKSCDGQIKKIYAEAKVDLPKKMLYRPGCGLFHNQMLKTVKDMDYHLTLGSVYPNDPSIPFGFINYYYLINHIEPGDIVILHDRKWTPELLRMLLPWLKDQGYICVTVDELLA